MWEGNGPKHNSAQRNSTRFGVFQFISVTVMSHVYPVLQVLCWTYCFNGINMETPLILYQAVAAPQFYSSLNLPPLTNHSQEDPFPKEFHYSTPLKLHLPGNDSPGSFFFVPFPFFLFFIFIAALTHTLAHTPLQWMLTQYGRSLARGGDWLVSKHLIQFVIAIQGGSSGLICVNEG